MTGASRQAQHLLFCCFSSSCFHIASLVQCCSVAASAMFSLFTGACNRIKFFFLFTSLTIFVGFFSRLFAPPATLLHITTYRISFHSLLDHWTSVRECAYGINQKFSQLPCIYFCVFDSSLFFVSFYCFNKIMHRAAVHTKDVEISRKMSNSQWPWIRWNRGSTRNLGNLFHFTLSIG